jgi:fructokinase
MPNTAVLVIGEALMDVIASPGSAEHRTESPGGSPANVALGLGRLGRLGRDVTLVTQLGADPRGEVITEHLRDSAVTTVNAAPPRAHTSSATAYLDADGSARYDFDVTWEIERPADLGHPSLVHTGSLAAVLSPGAEVVRSVIAELRQSAIASFDPNCRPQLMGDVATARQGIEEWVRTSDVVKVSEEDLQWLYPDTAEDQSAARWAQLGPSLVVLTRGAAGASAWLGEARVDVPAVAVEVVDTVGAGDAFMAALLDELVDELSAGRLAARSDARPGESRRLGLHPERVRLALLTGAAAAAITVSRPGANLPRRGELDDLLQQLR